MALGELLLSVVVAWPCGSSTRAGPGGDERAIPAPRVLFVHGGGWRWQHEHSPPPLAVDAAAAAGLRLRHRQLRSGAGRHRRAAGQGRGPRIGLVRVRLGSNPVRQRAPAPAGNTARSRAFPLLHERRPHGMRQALQAAGSAVDTAAPGRWLARPHPPHRELGDPDVAATPVLDARLRKLFGS